MSDYHPWITAAAMDEMRRVHTETLTLTALQQRAAVGPDSAGLADYAEAVLISTYPAPVEGDVFLLGQLVGGGRVSHVGRVAYDQDVKAGDRFIIGTTRYSVLGVGRRWRMSRPLALEEIVNKSE